MVAGIGVLAIGGVLYFLIHSSATPNLDSVVSETATATTLKKNLAVTPAGSTQTEDIATSTIVAQGDLLTTSQDGRGLITMSNGSTAVLDYRSSLVVKTIDSSGTHTSLSLIAGSAWARVEKVFGQGEYFEIKTQNAVAVVRGTSFGLTYHQNGPTTLLVGKGVVLLTPLDPKTGQRQEDKTLTIPAGYKGVISTEGTGSQSVMDASDTGSDWFKYNNGDSAGASRDNTIKAATPSASQQPASPVVQDSAPALPKVENPVKTLTTDPQSSPIQTSIPTVADTPGANACGLFTDTQGITSDTSVSLALQRVSPASISQSSSSMVSLFGSGLHCVTNIYVGNKTLNGESDFTVVSNDEISFPANILPIGTFDVVLMDTLGNIVMLPKALTVTR